MTARPDYLTQITRDWLDDLGFPHGNVRLKTFFSGDTETYTAHLTEAAGFPDATQP